MENQNNTQTFFRFEDLRVYHKALNYIEWVHRTICLLPEIENQSLSTNFINSAQVIAIQIAEGSSRNKTQFANHLKTAKSAIRECVVYTAIAKNLNYISEDHFNESRNLLMELTKMVAALIGSLQRGNTTNQE